MVKRLIDWIVGNDPDNVPDGIAQSAQIRGNIFLGRDFDSPKPESLKVVCWVDSRGSGTDTR